jgi:hypothetical protein
VTRTLVDSHGGSIVAVVAAGASAAVATVVGYAAGGDGGSGACSGACFATRPQSTPFRSNCVAKPRECIEESALWSEREVPT